ncbi:hypothetical protein WA026_013198 [Henosepilachna vigintioctopunctata]|uniref:Uncharacterized protein n=1 Tax=Henosepilachna vigintioctopunctata TaxID=420089 RepID=A0AAW1UB68_9CUCU
MNLDFNLVRLLFFGYILHLSKAGGGGKHEKVHVKIHVPHLINKHHHTKIVYIHQPVHKSEPKKPVVVHHHHHHKHDHGHKHKHGHNHGHKHDHKHKHGHNHKHQHIRHHHYGDTPHHHHHHKKQRYTAREHFFEHVPGDGYTTSHKSLNNEKFHSHVSKHPFRSIPPSSPVFKNNYRVTENYNDYGPANNDGYYQYPPLNSYVNADAEYVTTSGNEDESEESGSITGDDHENLNEYSPEVNYEYTHEPVHNEGYYDYEEETRKQLVSVGPKNHLLVSKTISVGDNDGRYVTRSTELI